MKKVLLPLIAFCSLGLIAAIAPRTCEQHLLASDYLVEGIVKEIAVELDCWSASCNFYSLNYTADLLITDVIKGGDSLKSGDTIKISYQDNFQYPRGGESAIPGFQGHSPLPNQWEYWAVFFNTKVLDRSNDIFEVAPPNGWWSYTDAETLCWK